MYYIIKERYGLKGWNDIPYALYDFTSGSVQVLDNLAFNTLSLCNGKVDNIALLTIHLEAIDQLRKFDIIEECNYGCELQEYQKYKAASCKFIFSAHWSITGKCNLKCKHCYMSAPQNKYGELTKEQCFDIIDKLSQANIYRVALTGGEPLVHKNFWDIVDKLSSRKICITQIYTNGVLINQKLLDNFKKRNLNPEFSVSFDGIGCHDWLRGLDGAEKSVIKAIKALVSNDFRVSAEMSLNKNNKHSLYDSVVFLADLGVSHIKVTPTSESGNWIKENGEYTLQIQEL